MTNVDQLDKLANLALKDKSLLHDALAKPKVGPWMKTHIFTQYTKNGTALLDYATLSLERNINRAIEIHAEEVAAEEAAMRAASSRKASRKSKKFKKKGEKLVKMCWLCCVFCVKFGAQI